MRVTNRCSENLYIEHNLPPSLSPNNIKLNPGQSCDLNIPDAGLPSTRFWAKRFCNESGFDCAIGQSEEPCPESGCAPPLDTKMEATWAPISCADTDGTAACVSWADVSLVDGYSLPATVKFTGGQPHPDIDASRLDLSRCPAAEDLSMGNMYPAYRQVDLRILDPNSPARILGCMSPCKALNYGRPYGYSLSEQTEPAVHHCCPTPPLSPAQCSDASNPHGVVHTQYVRAVKAMAPGLYSYAYDDVAGLVTVSAQTRVELVYCP